MVGSLLITVTLGSLYTSYVFFIMTYVKWHLDKSSLFENLLCGCKMSKWRKCSMGNKLISASKWKVRCLVDECARILPCAHLVLLVPTSSLSSPVMGSVPSLWPGLSARGLFGRSVGHSFLKGREAPLPFSYRSTCLE